MVIYYSNVVSGFSEIRSVVVDFTDFFEAKTSFESEKFFNQKLNCTVI